MSKKYLQVLVVEAKHKQSRADSHSITVTEFGSQEPEFRIQNSGIRNQESGIRNQESGIRNQESGILLPS
jgi:hypothetical protein